jgi:hypothetical protein
MNVTRLLPNICTDRMAETREFYVDLLGFVVRFEHLGWYIQVSSATYPQLQIGIVRRDHESQSIPAAGSRSDPLGSGR